MVKNWWQRVFSFTCRDSQEFIRKKEDDVIKLIRKILRLRPKIVHFSHITLNFFLLGEKKFYSLYQRQ